MASCKKNETLNSTSSPNANDSKSIKQQAIERWKNEGGGIANMQVNQHGIRSNIHKEFDSLLKAKLRKVLG